MRVDSLQFKQANETEAKTPRFVVAILFDVGSLYITSHSGITSVPGIILDKALKRPSAISQRLVPDEGRSEIGTFSFDIVDLASGFTDEARAKLAAGKGLRGKTVQLWCGFKGFDFSAFQLFQTQIISDCEYDEGTYTITCEDITRQQRTNIFESKETTLAATITATDATIQVATTTSFLNVAHGSAWSDAPSSTVGYVKIDQEIIRYTGKTSTTFTGCTRGQFNTVAAAHTVDPAAPQERRPKVTEFVYLDMPAPKLALALQLGVILNSQASPWPASLLGAQGGFQTDTNADGIADGWVVTVIGADASRVQTATRPAGSSPFVGVCQRLAITSVTNANESAIQWTGPCRAGLNLTLSGYVRTNVSSKVRLQIIFQNAAGATITNSLSGFVAGDSIAHLAQVTAVAPAGTETVAVLVRGINVAAEFLEADQLVLELGSTVNAYTGTPIQGLLPQHWHMGLPVEFVRVADFTGIGLDLWNTSDDSAGFITRFEGMSRTDGKRFVEKELYLLLGAYSPVYSDGTVGLRRLPAMVSDAAPVATLTEREIVSITPLKHDYGSLHNQIRVTWGYDIGLGRFTRDTLFIDAQSVAIHGIAPPAEYTFRGLHSGVHTENVIRIRLNAIRDAYSYPPQRTSAVVLGSLNRYETGDVLRLKVKNVRDFAGSLDDIDRAFLAIRRSINFITGELEFEMFGSTLRPDASGPSTEVTAPLPDAFYNSAGVALNTVIGMTGNNVNAGTHTIPGNVSLTAAGAIVYHLGDLVVPSGATINIANNVQLRVRGFITMNGLVNGVGGGLAGISDPGITPLLAAIDGTPGFIGNSRGWDGINMHGFSQRPPIENMLTIPVAIAKGKFEAWPELNLRESAGQLVGLPTDLRGTGGPPGGRTILGYQGGTIASAGGAGGAGGAGLAIVCRGMSFGVSALINLNGNNTTNPAVTAIPTTQPDIYPGAGGAGGPGACLMVIDGNTQPLPNALGRFQAKTGTITQAGVPLPHRTQGFATGNFELNPTLDPWSGYQDEQVVSNLDMSIAALRIVYVPYTQTPATDQNRLPGPITALTVVGASGFNSVTAALPPADEFDLVEYYAAITNNRAGAVLVARGRISDFKHELPVLSTRFYWARTTRTNDRGQEFYSDWFPAGATSGVSATSLNPGGWTPIVTQAGGATMIATASTLEKSGGTTAYDSQAYSAESYPACAVSWRAADATHSFLMGLNTDPTTDASYTSIDYCWENNLAGTLFITENGSVKSFSGTSTYDATTVLSITYDGENVRYFRNGILARTAASPGRVFFLDSSFYSPGAKALDVKFNSQPKLTDANRLVVTGNAAYSGTSITKTGGAASTWDAQCYSIDGYTEGAFASARAADITSQMMFALNSDPTTDANYTSLDYAWFFNAGSSDIWESGVSIGVFGTYSTSTVLAIRHIGPLIQYIKDGVVVRSVARTAVSPLFFDSSLATTGGTMVDVQFGPAGRGAEADPSAVYLQTFEDPWETSFANLSNASNLVVSYPNNGQFGGKVIRAQRQLYIQSNENIPFDSTALYRISTRLRRTSSGGGTNEAVFCGVAAYDAAGALLNIWWNCADAFNLGAIAINTWVDFVGYFRGTTAISGIAPNVDSPTGLDSGTASFRPVFVLNYNTGTGTQECDFIKVERLINPPDVDNTAKQRVVPDAEFGLATDSTYWDRIRGATIASSGGNVEGYAELPYDSSLDASVIYSIPQYPQQAVRGEMFSVYARIRRKPSTPTPEGQFFAGLQRLNQPTFAASSGGGGSYGGILVAAADILTSWTEYSALCMVSGDFVDGAYPFVCAQAFYQTLTLSGLTDGVVQVDYLNLVRGAGAKQMIYRLTATTNLQNWNPAGVGAFPSALYMNRVVYDSASPGTLTLPSFFNPQDVGVTIAFEQVNSGALSVAYGGGTRTFPNSTATRTLNGRYATAIYTADADTTWHGAGQFV